MQTTRPGGVVRRADAAITKNDLTEPELQILHRVVNLYIEYAELQALERRPMTMRDWIGKLDELLKASGRKLLDHPGTISAETARAKAELEHERYHAREDAKPHGVRRGCQAAREACSNAPKAATEAVVACASVDDQPPSSGGGVGLVVCTTGGRGGTRPNGPSSVCGSSGPPVAAPQTKTAVMMPATIF
jgi:hypothetical protein